MMNVEKNIPKKKKNSDNYVESAFLWHQCHIYIYELLVYASNIVLSFLFVFPLSFISILCGLLRNISKHMCIKTPNSTVILFYIFPSIDVLEAFSNNQPAMPNIRHPHTRYVCGVYWAGCAVKR